MGQIERKNVFVVGAGASAEFLLPTGRGLLENITNLVKSEYRSGLRVARSTCSGEIDQALAAIFRLGNPGRPYTEHDRQRLISKAAWLCRNCALAPSIDNLLHTHNGDAELVSIGKVLIAQALVDAEKGSLLYQSESSGWFINNKKKIKDEELRPTWSWLGELFWLLVELRNFENFLHALRQITFISFNYDRCIEHFLVNAATSYFNLGGDDIFSVRDSLKILRPYGTLGGLRFDGSQTTGFGKLSGTLHETSLGLRTFTEGVGNPDVLSGIKAAFSDADLVFFLGFGYLDLNLEILLKEGPFAVDRVIGTRFGLSDESNDIVIKSMSPSFLYRGFINANGEEFRHQAPAAPIFMSDLKCQGLLQKHQFFLRSNRRYG